MRNLLLLAGLGSALGAMGTGHLYLTRLEEEVSGGAKVSVLVLAKDAPAGTLLAAQQLVIRDIPEAYLDSRAVRATDTKRVVGNRLSIGLKAQQTLEWSDLSQYTDQGLVLATLVSSGLRAIELDSRVSDFDGLLRPGDRIDLLFTSNDGADGHKSTITLLQNLLILSVGGTLERGDGTEGTKAKYSRGQGVTVSATLTQAQLITQAKTKGRLTLTLRNPDDVKVIEGLPETTDREIAELRSGNVSATPSADRQHGGL